MIKITLQLICTIIVLCSITKIQAQNIITTFYSGLQEPVDVCLDTSQNIYMLDHSPRVWKKTPQGANSIVAGNALNAYSGDGGPATAASLFQPQGIHVDLTGNIYVADYGNNRVRKISGGIINTIAGTGSNVYNGDGGKADTTNFNAPQAITIDLEGNIYLAAGFRVVHKIDTAGYTNFLIGNGLCPTGANGDGGPALAGQLCVPTDVTFDPAGNLYIADAVDNKIRKIDLNGVVTTFAGTGTSGYSGDGGPATAAQLNYPRNVAADALGNIYISDIGNYRIRKVNQAGIISTFAGNGSAGFSGDGGSALAAQFDRPMGIAVDAANNVYVADFYNGRIRKISIGSCNSYFSIFADSTVAGLYYGYNLGSGTGLSYLWDFGDGTTSTQPYPSHTYASAGQYYVCLTVNNGAGCSDTYCDSSYLVFKTEGGLMNQLNIINPNTGVLPVTKSAMKFRLLPNPSSNSVTIITDETFVGSQLAITDVTGKIMKSQQLQTAISHLSITDLVSGVYIVMISNGEQTSTNRLVIVR